KSFGEPSSSSRPRSTRWCAAGARTGTPFTSCCTMHDASSSATSPRAASMSRRWPRCSRHGKIAGVQVTHVQEHCVSSNAFERLLRLVGRTEEHELSCTECFEVLPRYVDLEVAGAAPHRLLPLFRQ